MARKDEAKMAFVLWVKRIGTTEAKRRLHVKQVMESDLRLCMQWCYEKSLELTYHKIVRDYDNLRPIDIRLEQAFEWLESLDYMPGPDVRARQELTRRIEEVKPT